ncbi:alpha-L-fucosidase [Spirosoma fluviale]|uniref:alpha-L-fucosidase n=1 Tax=Spirosoma fluviale TaxID=1597977 RepID=A0A286F9M8_9BACT|nr:alpha-L-fucosidase [Spirosoma fluviale]SOD79912.1 alpha-L-fucosidase [Spirosoma fluviale]
MKTRIIGLFLCITTQAIAQKALPQDQRLQWWRDARFGMFIHWGPVTATGKEISWSREGYGKSRYDSLYRRFNPTKFNAREWVKLAKANGLKYVVLTAKHHDGFCLFSTKTTGYNIMSSPFGRDVCKELADAVHAEGLKLGWYFSVADWKDPDCRNPATNDVFVGRMMDQLNELLSNYGKISLLWIDYEGSPCPTEPQKVYDLAHRLQPGIILNNRLEAFSPDESHCQPGKLGDYATPEGFVAGFGSVPWETCTNLGHQWAWRFDDTPRSVTESVHTLLRCIGGNGNLLLNVGPDSLGQIPPLFVTRLNDIGGWLNPRARAIYGTRGGPYLPATDYVCSQKGNRVFLYLLSKTGEKVVLPPLPSIIKSAALLNGPAIAFTQSAGQVTISVPVSQQDSVATIVELTLNQPVAASVLIPPFSRSHSLAYAKKAVASSQLGNFLHNAAATVDDNPNTYWKLGRRKDVDFAGYYGKTLSHNSGELKALFEKRGWLEVDLGQSRPVGEVLVSEFVRKDNGKPSPSVTRFDVQYQKGSQWVTLASGEQLDGQWRQKISPVTAQRFRLVILDSRGSIGISEFQLYPAGE